MSDPLQQLGAHFAGLWVRQETPYGQVFVGRDATGVEVTIAVLSATAAADLPLRRAFADVVWQHSVGAGEGAAVCAADLHAALPWAAVPSAAGQAGAEKLFDSLSAAAPTSPLTPPAAPGAAVVPPGSPPAAMSPAPAPGSPLGSPVPGSPPWAPVPGSPPGAPALGAPAVAAGAPRRGGPLPWLLGVAGGVMALVILVTGTVAAVRLLGSGSDPVPQPTLAAPPHTDRPQPTATGGSDGGGSGHDDEEDDDDSRPELRTGADVNVFGPRFSRGEETFTMQFPGWPFAFRTPMVGDEGWDCFRGEVESIPEARGWGCFGIRGSDQRVDVLLWECERGCPDAEQREMLEVWLGEPEQAVRPVNMPNLAYVETDENDSGNYEVDLGHFFGEEPGQPPLRWLVGVYAESPPETRDDVLKIVNDIVSQTA